MFPTITIAIPAYGRSREFEELLASVASLREMPNEVLVCEDDSPQRRDIRRLCEQYGRELGAKGVLLRYLENEKNLGYDGNLRRIIKESASDWVLLMGNDDIVLPEAISAYRHFINCHQNVRVISRAFKRFQRLSEGFSGTSCIAGHDCVLWFGNSSPGMLFRATGFVAGLVIDRKWAVQSETDIYDGGLYYQVYLGAKAYCEGGIGYVSKACVGGRSDNPPMFGSAVNERSSHVPGSYTPAGRVAMWKCVLDIGRDVGGAYGIELQKALRRELDARQCFHVFEMMCNANRRQLIELRQALEGIGLQRHPLPRLLFWWNFFFGTHARHLYLFARRVLQ